MATTAASKSSSTKKTTNSPAPKKSSQASSKGLEDLFLDGLKDIYYAEKKILKSLPKMAKGAESEEASAGFEKHRQETEGQVERLEQVFELMGVAARGKTCPPSTESLRRVRRSSKSVRARLHWTLALSRQPRLSNATKSPATAP